MGKDEVAQNGWTAVPVDASKIFKNGPYINKPEPLLAAGIHFPSDDPIVRQVQEYAKNHLPRQTYNHSMRVFYYATAIVRQQFPEDAPTFSPTTLALTCLLHDIGTARDNINATRMSFEFFGAIKSLNLLLDLGTTTDQAEAVCETIIRHQDLGTDGTITFLGQVIQLATIYDNVGDHPNVPNFGEILHEKTREDVNKVFPREGWLGCFANTIKEEVSLKPWCHTTHIPDFDKKVEANELMKPYE
ncbi:probable Cyanamide hydratase [Cephalotrichum gorgonifer]|uniref:Probable Cyanamide hydratase n=1 Tax=Cephalotrichum gorgonifer TaxID=2041049 RepID=A0AAE8N261_9PEZI|nr:probable Cyanamide hydratase [Cephalotrichum gorgonifer]